MEKVQDPSTYFKDQLQIKHIFGYRTDFKNNIFLHWDGQSIIYPAGNVIVFDNQESKPQKFLYCYPGSRGISCMAISLNRRWLAWAEIADSPIIVVYDLKYDKRSKILQSQDPKIKQYVSIDFSKTDENKHLIALSGSPDYQLLYFDWQKNRQNLSISCKVNETQKLTHCFYHPSFDEMIVVIGNGAIKTLNKLDANQKLKDITISKKDPKEQQHSTNYLSYCVLKDQNMIVGTDMGELLLFINNSNSIDYKMILQSSPREGFSIECLVPFSKGFLVGGQDCTVLIYEKHEGELRNPYIKLDKKIQNQKREYRFLINSMILANGEESLIIGLENKQILSVPFTSDRVISEENLKFDHIGLPYHSDKITGLDICIRKTLIGTCSTDRTVRIWNYMEHTLENYREFEEPAYALAFHPSGFHIIVAFAERIKLLNLFDRDIIPFKDILTKNCREISISNGGHLFAINHTQTIQVYQFYTGEQNFTMRIAGSNQGRIQSIFWEEDDLSFYTGSSEGQVFWWRIEDPNQKTVIFDKSGFQITSICSYNQSPNEKYVYVSGILTSGAQIQNQKQLQSTNTNNQVLSEDDQKCMYQIKIFYDKNSEISQNISSNNRKPLNISDPTPIYTGANISQIKLLNSGRLIFFATDEKNKPGCIRVCKTFCTVDIKDLVITEIQSHFSPITRLAVSFDDNYVFTAGEDGSLIIYENMNRELKIKLDKDGSIITSAEEFLMQKSIYNEEKQEIEKLNHQIHRLKFKQEQDAKEEERLRDDQIQKLNSEYENVNNTESAKYEKLEIERKKMENLYEEKKLKQKNQHEENKRKMEVDYKKKIALEMSRNEELAIEKEREYNRFKQEMEQIQHGHKKLVADKTQMYQQLLQKEKSEYHSLHEQKDKMIENFNKERAFLEEETEKDIEEQKEENEKKMKHLFTELDNSESQKRTKKTDFEQGAQSLEEQRSKLKEILEQISHIGDQNKQLKKETESHKKEILEREKTLSDKSRRIYELKKKTQELEKFKFVLDYKIKELKRDIGPKEEEIAKMKEQIANMQSEILHFKRTNANLKLIVTDLKLRKTGMMRETKNNDLIQNKNQQYIDSYKHDISQLQQYRNDYKNLKKQVLLLHTKYVVSDENSSKKKLDIGDKGKDTEQFINERSYLETSVKGLKEKFQKNMAVHETDNKRIMSQNVDLIKEINDLKREQKIIKEEKMRQTLLNKKKKDQGNSNEDLEILNKQIENFEAQKSKLQQQIDQSTLLNMELKAKLDPEKYHDQLIKYQNQVYQQAQEELNQQELNDYQEQQEQYQDLQQEEQNIQNDNF